MRDLQKTSALYIRLNCSTCNKTQCLLLFWDWDIRTLPIRIVLWDMRLDISNLVDPLITPIVKQGLKREGWSNSYTVRHSDVLVSYFRNWTVGLYTVNVNHDILNVVKCDGRSQCILPIVFECFVSLSNSPTDSKAGKRPYHPPLIIFRITYRTNLKREKDRITIP